VVVVVVREKKRKEVLTVEHQVKYFWFEQHKNVCDNNF
jgi:hypothetical protein